MEYLNWVRLDCGAIDESAAGIGSYLATHDGFFARMEVLQ
jgi:hypothetical protein